jgi:hypothetical protein
MNTQQRAELLERYDATNRWLSRVYDPRRSPEHRVGIWNFLMVTADDKLRNLLVSTRTIDEDCVRYWDTYGKN